MDANPVELISARRHGDDRGWFAEVYNQRDFAARGLVAPYVQDNHSLSREANVLRGLHFQTPPHAQAKLVRCIRGAILDVAVDLRRGSPTYGKSVSAILSAENGDQLAIPVGFAHGFLTLEPDTEVFYKVTAFYAPAHDSGLAWNDPDIGIEWRLGDAAPILSAKDNALGTLMNFDSPFAYDGRPLLPLTHSGVSA